MAHLTPKITAFCSVFALGCGREDAYDGSLTDRLVSNISDASNTSTVNPPTVADAAVATAAPAPAVTPDDDADEPPPVARDPRPAPTPTPIIRVTPPPTRNAQETAEAIRLRNVSRAEQSLVGEGTRRAQQAVAASAQHAILSRDQGVLSSLVYDFRWLASVPPEFADPTAASEALLVLPRWLRALERQPSGQIVQGLYQGLRRRRVL